MPSTRSSAATKCISEVPGLVKQTSTPPATNVRTRLSAPFMVSLPFVFVLRAGQDQTLFPRFVKGLAAQCSHECSLASDVLPFLTAASENAAVTGCLLAKS